MTTDNGITCILKMELTTELERAREALQRLDDFMRGQHTDIALNPPEAFMSAWNKVKTARALLLSINLEEYPQ